MSRKGIRWYKNVGRWRDIATGHFTTYSGKPTRPKKQDVRKPVKRKPVKRKPVKRKPVKRKSVKRKPVKEKPKKPAIDPSNIGLPPGFEPITVRPKKLKRLTPLLETEKESVLLGMRAELSKAASNLDKYHPAVEYAENSDGSIDAEIVLQNVYRSWDGLRKIRLKVGNLLDPIPYAWVSMGLLLPPKTVDDEAEFYKRYKEQRGAGSAFAYPQVAMREDGESNVAEQVRTLGMMVKNIRRSSRRMPTAMVIRLHWNPGYTKPDRW